MSDNPKLPKWLTDPEPRMYMMKPFKNRGQFGVVNWNYNPYNYHLNDDAAEIIKRWLPDFDPDHADIPGLEALMLTEFGISPTDVQELTWPNMLAMLSRRNPPAIAAQQAPQTPMTNIPDRISAPPELLEQAVSDLLGRIPDTWQEYRPDDLTETQSQGLFLLVAAGMVERRERLRMRMFNHPLVAEATITCTGEYGGIEAMQPLIASLWSDWQDAFREWEKGDTANMPPAHCERLEPSEWRLTDQGQIAQQDIQEGEQKTVFDFVLKRGFFDGRPRPLPDGRVSRREPVRGYGALVSMEKKQAADLNGNGAGTVNVGNWREGGDAFAQAFGPMLAKAFEGLQAQEDAKAEPPAKTEKKGRRKGRKKLPPKEERRRRAILERWERASGECSRKDFCADEGITVKQLENFQRWKKQRENRGE
jgi:hypothetical protein